jgi:methylenetetrahydrofolate reductase (NADPH)
MKVDSKLASMIKAGDFIVTAECTPGASASSSAAEGALKALGKTPAAVNLADTSHGLAMSSLAASVTAIKMGIEPVLQLVTRDRNRIALQSDLLGAASLGIRNVLCMSGYHQTLMGCPESANVFDIDSTQLIGLVARMTLEGVLLDGTHVDGSFSMLPGAVANPFLKPLELNLFRLDKKVEAGAAFVQTHPVFDVEAFKSWLEAARAEGITGRTAILAGVYPLQSVDEAIRLRDTFAEFRIPDSVVERLSRAGDASREGLAICAEAVRALKAIDGVRGIHIMSGGRESLVPELAKAAGL